METGWLIEKPGARETPLWLCGVIRSGPKWTVDSYEAIRFARKLDADRMIAELELDPRVHTATEHQWS